MKNDGGVLGRSLQLSLVLLAVIVMLLGGLKFFFVSIIFYALGGFYEFIIMNRFYSKSKEKISYKDKLAKKTKAGFLWVHQIIDFRKRYSNTIYNFKKEGVVTCMIAYIVMLIYVVVARLLFNLYSYYGFLVYLIPVVTNGFSFWKSEYFIK